MDNLRANIDLLDDPYKRALALAAVSRACMKRRPRGIFTYVGDRYDDGRRDLRLSLKRHFLDNVTAFNAAVFDNSQANLAYNTDTLSLDVEVDLVYLDPPYYTPHSDNDYTRRYHFVEGLVRGWQGVEIQTRTKTKKIRSYHSSFSKKQSAYESFEKLFHRFRKSIIVLSYSSNSLPTKDEIISMLKAHKNTVEIIEVNHTYSFGNQGHKLNNGTNRVQEYIFVAT